MTRSEAALLVSVREKEARLGDIRLTFGTVTSKGGLSKWLLIRREALCSCSIFSYSLLMFTDTWVRALHAA